MTERPNAALYLWALLLLCTWPLMTGLAGSGKVSSLIEAGNRYYGKGDFKQALAKYEQAAQIEPDRPTIAYNRAAALYRLDQFDKAREGFNSAARRADDQLKQFAEYNAGTCALRKGDLDQGIESLKRALTLNPDDQWAKHNLEMALRAKQQQRQPQNKKQDDKDREKPKQQKESKQARQPRQNKDQQQKDEQQPEDQDDAPQSKQEQERPHKDKEAAEDERDTPDQEQAQARAQQQQLTREQAERLLQQLAQEDEKMQKLIRRAPMTPERPTDKDW